MGKIRYMQAVRQALTDVLRNDPNTFVMGLDMEKSAMGTTDGLLAEFGKSRVISTPLSELGFTGLGVGAAMAGLRPVIEFQINSLQYLTMEQLVNQAAKLRYMTGGQVDIPLTIRVSASGGGMGMAAQHSDSAYAQLIHMGLKTVVPSTPYDVKGLISAAVQENDPVVIYEPAVLYGTRGEVPDEPYTIPIGKADIKREGTDITIVAVGHLVIESLKAAEKLEQEGISVEVVDPRTLFPLDTKTIIESVSKTKNLLVVDDGYRFCSFASEVAAIVSEECFDILERPVQRVTRPHIPVPYSKILEREVLPGEKQILESVRNLLSKELSR